LLAFTVRVHIQKIRQGKAAGRLTEEQIRRLDELGFSWDDYFTKQWNYAYGRLCVFKERHGHVNVPTAYVDETELVLGKWLSRQRDNRRLSEDKRAKLTELGVSFEQVDPWKFRFSLAKKFF